MKFCIVIPSKNPENCVACVRAIREHEPELPPHRIIVVDDGARLEAEAELARRFIKGPNGEQVDITNHADKSGISWIPGKQPFVFARNVNLGVRCAFELQKVDGVILLNDDARLMTPCGFTILQQVAEGERQAIAEGDWKDLGVASATFTGAVGNPLQISGCYRGSAMHRMIRVENRVLAFIAVYIPRDTWETVGELDERFAEGYGWEDNDYCRRCIEAERVLIICEHCLVEHGRLPSTFRAGNESLSIYNENARAYFKKWADLESLPIPEDWWADLDEETAARAAKKCQR